MPANSPVDHGGQAGADHRGDGVSRSFREGVVGVYLFTPPTLRGVNMRPPRVDVADDAVRTTFEGADEGSPSDWHLQHLGSRAVAGAALVMTE